MGTIEKRIESLEKAMLPVDWEPVEIRIYVEDCSLPGKDKPKELSFIIKSGTPAKPGRRYHREAAETETSFLARVEVLELAALTGKADTTSPVAARATI